MFNIRAISEIGVWPWAGANSAAENNSTAAVTRWNTCPVDHFDGGGSFLSALPLGLKKRLQGERLQGSIKFFVAASSAKEKVLKRGHVVGPRSRATQRLTAPTQCAKFPREGGTRGKKSVGRCTSSIRACDTKGVTV